MLEDFEKEIKTNRNSSDFINILGIGVFSIYSLFELSDFIKYVLQQVFIINEVKAKTILWLPSVISLIFFTLILITVIKSFNKRKQINFKRTLNVVVTIFFVIIIFQFLFSFFVSPIFLDNYSQEYELYYDNIDGYYEIQAYVGFISILEYLILAFVFMKRKTA